MRRDELALLDVHDAPGASGGHQQVRLPAEERGDLQDVRHLGGRLRLRRLRECRSESGSLPPSRPPECAGLPASPGRDTRRRSCDWPCRSDALKTNAPTASRMPRAMRCTCSSLSITHGPAISTSGRLAEIRKLNRHGRTRTLREQRLLNRRLAPVAMLVRRADEALNSGCGSIGLDLNSGWNWQPRIPGMVARSRRSRRRCRPASRR